MITIIPTVKDSCRILQLIGRLDSTTSSELNEYLSADDFSEYTGVILEMTELDYISSAGLRVLLNASKTLKKKDKLFVLCGMQDHIREIFEISGFNTFLEIDASLEAALRRRDIS